MTPGSTGPQAAPATATAASEQHVGKAPRTSGEDVAKALGYLLRSTQQRPQTEAELASKLRCREVDDDVAEAALAHARALGAVDDAAFAHAWVEDRGRKRGYGRPRLRQELQRRLVPQPLIEAALSQLDDRDDLATATELARRRSASLPASLAPPAVARRLEGFLARRGYGAALARRVAIDVSGLDRFRSWD